MWTVRVRRGITFADDPAFNGKPRELVAADYVYAFKRIYDPQWKSPSYSSSKPGKRTRAMFWPPISRLS